MSLPTADAIQHIFSQPPAAFRFLRSAGRITAAAGGAAMQIAGPADAPTSVSLAVVLPPNNQRMAARGGILLTLLLAQLAPGWGDGAQHWLAGMLQAAARDPALTTASQTTRAGLRFLLTTDRAKSLAQLTVIDEGGAP